VASAAVPAIISTAAGGGMYFMVFISLSLIPAIGLL
jgi:hypothetical protein